MQVWDYPFFPFSQQHISQLIKESIFLTPSQTQHGGWSVLVSKSPGHKRKHSKYSERLHHNENSGMRSLIIHSLPPQTQPIFSFMSHNRPTFYATEFFGLAFIAGWYYADVAVAKETDSNNCVAQGLANLSLQAKTYFLPVFVSKVLLEHSLIHLILYGSWLLSCYNYRAEQLRKRPSGTQSL